MAGLADLGSLLPNDYVEKSRKAGQGLTLSRQALEDIMAPWSDYERDPGQPNYVGRTEDEWLANNRMIRDELINLAGGRQAKEDLLVRKGFTNQLERRNILNNLSRFPVLHTEQMWVPGAVADENMSQAVLHYSGFQPVKMGNEGDPMATDLMATVGGVPMRIDAQTRTAPGGPLILGVTKYDRGGNQSIIRQPDKKLIDIITERRFTDGIKEDKLLHTLDPIFNPIQSRHFNERALTHVKDMLISSNRAGFRGHGNQPYNPELPHGWDLIDLDKAREILLNSSIGELSDKYGITTANPRTRRGRTGSALVLPADFVERELRPRAGMELGSEARRQLSRKKR